MTKLITDAELAKLRELEARATKGKWSHVYVPGRRTPGWVGEPGEYRLVVNGDAWDPINAHKPTYDGLLVAELRNAAPLMLDSIARLKEALAIAMPYLPKVLNNTRDEAIEWEKKQTRIRELVGDGEPKRGLSALLGKWPGDETDEQIAAALKGDK